MIKRWGVHRGYVMPEGHEAVTTTAVTGMEALCMPYIEMWYHTALLTADPGLLEVREEAATLTELGPTLTLPEGTLRVAAVKLKGWKRCATITTEGSALADRQASGLTAGTRSRPVAVYCPRQQSLSLYPAPKAGDELETLGLIGRYDDKYHFDESLLPQ